MKVITFSRQFPKNHPRAGHPTRFVEKIWKSLYVNGECPDDLNQWIKNYPLPIDGDYNDTPKKIHTIRSGTRWKAGDWFSARVWLDRPYASKQHEFAQIKVVETIPFSLDAKGYILNGRWLKYDELVDVSRNDGLSLEDFECWFSGSLFDGQIVSWYPIGDKYGA